MVRNRRNSLLNDLAYFFNIIFFHIKQWTQTEQYKNMNIWTNTFSMSFKKCIIYYNVFTI